MHDMDDSFTPRTASEWLVVLNEEPDDAGLRVQFENWLAASPAHAQDWREMTGTYEIIRKTTPVFEEQWRKPLAPLQMAKVYWMAKLSQVPRRAVMGAALAACLMLFYAPNVLLWMEADQMTATAEQRQFALQDGSVIYLGPDSAVSVDYSADERQVHLLKGQAFFEVSREPARPFRVISHHIETTVLGTSFNVQLIGPGVNVSVKTGLVHVVASGFILPVSENLEPGDWVRISADGTARRGESLLTEIAAWREGEIIARDLSVADVIDQIRPWYRGVIFISNAELSRQPLTGIYHMSDPVEAVRAIAESQGARLTQISPWMMVLSGG